MIGDAKLDLGSGGRHFAGYVSLDRDPKTKPDVVCDIENRFPFDDNAFDEVRAFHILEHVHTEKKTAVMYEIWRVLKPGGIVEIEMPAFPHVQSVMDPTHLSFWCRESFWYYTADSKFHEAFRDRSTEPVPAFSVIESSQEGFLLRIKLKAVK
jgi:SAM-dependent methyltransferase